jgi:DNA-binding GntR family transcriptional regulator
MPRNGEPKEPRHQRDPSSSLGLMDPLPDPTPDDSEAAVIQPLPGQVTRSEEVLGVLTRAIVERELPAGSLHSAVTLAQKLNVSKTPVREALLQLEQRGLVSFQRGRGVRILETSTGDLVEIFQARLWLEPPATRLAVSRVGPGEIQKLRSEYERMVAAGKARNEQRLWAHDRAFHLVILNAAGNLQVARYVDSLRELALLHGATFAALRGVDMVEVAKNHEPVLRAIEAGVPDAAEEAMYEHVLYAAKLVVGPEGPKALLEGVSARPGAEVIAPTIIRA